jgi:hypothetical protein
MKVWVFAVVILFTFFGVANAQDYGEVVAEKAVIRSQAANNGKAVAEIGRGFVVEVIEKAGSWYRVQTETDSGWLPEKSVRLLVSASALKAPSRTSRSSAPAKSKKSSTAGSSGRSTGVKMDSGYIRGPRGGCYYLNGSRKVYVDRSLCN